MRSNTSCILAAAALGLVALELSAAEDPYSKSPYMGDPTELVTAPNGAIVIPPAFLDHAR